MGAMPKAAVLSDYYDKAKIDTQVGSGKHRIAIGGNWEPIGQLQLDFLRDRGLKPEHKLLDIGCGSLRAGVKLVRYLNADNYFGTDINESLLQAGYDVELAEQGLQNKLPRANLVTEGDFDFSWCPAVYDFALAQCVFSHLPLVHLRVCLERLHPHMAPGGSFFATFFEIPDHHPNAEQFRHPGGIVTSGARDPYHHKFSEVEFCCRYLPWKANLIGDWGHPFSQRKIQQREQPARHGRKSAATGAPRPKGTL
jgi:SAM-dependent methyltransferase